MKKFKLYLEIPSTIGSITHIRMDKMIGFEDIIDYNQLALHMAQQNFLIEKGAKYQMFMVYLDKDRFNTFLKEINRKQKHVLSNYVIVSDGTFPLVQIMEKSVIPNS